MSNDFYRLTSTVSINVKDANNNTVACREARTIYIGILEWVLECPVSSSGEDRLYKMLSRTLGTHNADGLASALPFGNEDWNSLLEAATTCYEILFDINVNEDSTDIVIILKKPVGSPHVTLRLCFRRPAVYSEYGHEVESTLTEVEFDGYAVLG